MKILLIRPDPGNERFGLGPFFRVEPLGLEYIGAELLRRGHETEIVDARFEPDVARRARRFGPELVGISGMHALEYDQVLAAARAVRRAAPDAFIVAGGHAASAYSGPLETSDLDAICTDDGEEIFPSLADALDAKRPPGSVPGLRVRNGREWAATAPLEDRAALDAVPLPARALVRRYRNRYHCLLFKPVWLIETARGCPFRCSFCSVWPLYGRSFRERAIGAVADDFESVGENVFVVDDLFWNHPERSRALARELRRRGVRKRWMLVQSRTDIVCRHPDLLAEWRPIARDFDVFFGLEAATDSALRHVVKDATANQSVEAARVARALAYGVTGNFLVDPDWEERDFRELWDFVAENGFQRAGYTILTPLPGTELFRRSEDRVRGQPWFKFDMSHVLWEPRLGARRFFELYAETWRRSILNTAGEKSWFDWVRQVRPSQVPYLLRVLSRTQRMMKTESYLREHEARREDAAVVGEASAEGA